MIINLIRHGYTQGNLEQRYVGTTDEPLCIYGIQELDKRIYPPCDAVYCSPMIRCIQTAKIIYPNMDIQIVDDFRETNFGDFEYMNYVELASNSYYQKWIDSNGMLPFPNGESREEYSRRSYSAFQTIVTTHQYGQISLIVHGGTIMSIMEQLIPSTNYYDFHIENGGYITFDTTRGKIV